MHTCTQEGPAPQPAVTNQVHRVNESCRILGIGRSTYYVLRREGLIEPPIRISKRARGHTSTYLQSLIQKMGANDE